MKTVTRKLKDKITIYLSHRPGFYALIVGVGIVWFWRGVWHTTDLLHSYFEFFQSNSTTIGSISSVWWDGLLSLISGIIILYFTGAFTSSFIGNELILSGLRGEKRLNQKQEKEVRNEERIVLEIKDEIQNLSEKINGLDLEIQKKNFK
ncbi:MAG: hypothetical protein WCX46_00915 [Candidatus Paceibacterota bacterium]